MTVTVSQAVPTLHIAGRLYHFWERWEEWDLDYLAVSVIKDGYNLDFWKKTSPVKYSFDSVGLDKKPVVTRTILDSFGEGNYRGCGRQVVSKLLFKTVSSSQTKTINGDQ